MKRPVANLYVDGFNLYYGCVRNTPYRWLELQKLARFMLPDYEVGRIRYFTARVRARPDDPHKPTRQDAYLRALQTLPNLTVHEGFFLESKTRARLPVPIPCQAKSPCLPNLHSVEVYKTEEKGSDVNLATWMLLDAIDHDGQASFVVSQRFRSVPTFGSSQTSIHPPSWHPESLSAC